MQQQQQQSTWPSHQLQYTPAQQQQQQQQYYQPPPPPPGLQLQPHQQPVVKREAASAPGVGYASTVDYLRGWQWVAYGQLVPVNTGQQPGRVHPDGACEWFFLNEVVVVTFLFVSTYSADGDGV